MARGRKPTDPMPDPMRAILQVSGCECQIFELCAVGRCAAVPWPERHAVSSANACLHTYLPASLPLSHNFSLLMPTTS